MNSEVISKFHKPAAYGFTLIEALVALVVLTIVISAALESQITSIKMERAVSASHTVCFAIDRILVRTCLGHAETNITEAGATDCNIFWKPVRIESRNEPFETFSPVARDLSKSTSADMVRWEIVPKERSSFKTAVFTHRVLQ